MAYYNIDFKPSVEKDFSRLPQSIVLRAMEKIETLSYEPFPPGTKKLKDTEQLFRIRLGDYRIVYEVDSKFRTIVIHYIRHRKDVYRK